MLCGISSWFNQVTVLPTFTVNGVGEKVKLSMITSASAAAAMPARLPISTTAPAPNAWRSSRRRALPPGSNVSCMAGTSAGQRRVDDGQRRLR